MKKVAGYPSSMFLKDNAASTMRNKCDLFADFFESVYLSDSGDVNRRFGLEKCVDIGTICVSEATVVDALESFDVSKNDGPAVKEMLGQSGCPARPDF